MEEVDAILISQLREIGCDSIDDEVKNVGNLDPIELMKCVARCLGRILSGHDTITVPSANELFTSMNMSIKFKIANQLSELIRDIGFKSDIGYQSFLYGNEHEIRRLLLFLIERIPREDESSKALLDSNDGSDACRTLKALRRMNLSTVWLPPDTTNRVTNYFEHPSQSSSLSSLKSHKLSEDIEFNLSKFLNKSQPKSLQRVAKTSLSNIEQQYLLPQMPLQILEYNSYEQKLLYELQNNTLLNDDDYSLLLFSRTNESSSTPIINDQHLQSITSVDDDDNGRLNSLQTDVHKNDTEKKAEYYDKTLEELKQQLHNVQQTIQEHEYLLEEYSRYEQELARKHKQYEANCKSEQELASDVEKVRGQIEELTKAWQTVQNELFEQIDQLKNQSMAQNAALKDQILRVTNLKRMIQSKMKDLETKRDLVADLNANLPNEWPPGRAAYTKRIMEIIVNVNKQNAETRKVLHETKSIQKEINALNGKITRIFAVSEETIFRDAKQNDWNRKCYKTLALLKANFDQLLGLVSSVGTYLREIRNLEEIVSLQNERCAETNLTRINADLAQIQAENSQLQKRLQQQQ